MGASVEVVIGIPIHYRDILCTFRHHHPSLSRVNTIMNIPTIIQAIEDARQIGILNNDAARAATVALGLTGHDAMLACRIIAQGADPASIEYLVTGQVSDSIALAHRQGPGSLTGVERDRWLCLAGLSADESKDSTLRHRFTMLADAANIYRDDRIRTMLAGQAIEHKISKLPYICHIIGGRMMRLYTEDLGFASAYWQGEPCAAVMSSYDGKPYIAVGSSGKPLADLGITVTKTLSPCFGIIEDAATIERVSLNLCTKQESVLAEPSKDDAAEAIADFFNLDDDEENDADSPEESLGLCD